MTKSSLDKMDDFTLEQTAERVATLANGNIAGLADYDIVAADITALTTARTAFAAKKTAPRMAVSERKAQTESLPTLIGNVRSIFRNELDKMVTKKKKTAPDFHRGYFTARVIVDRPGSHGSTPVTPPATP